MLLLYIIITVATTQDQERVIYLSQVWKIKKLAWSEKDSAYQKLIRQAETKEEKSDYIGRFLQLTFIVHDCALSKDVY